jgi:hypothetical protein
MDPLQDASFTIAEPAPPSPTSISPPAIPDFMSSNDAFDQDEHTFSSYSQPLQPPSIKTSPTTINPIPIPAPKSPNGTPCCELDFTPTQINIPESQKLNDYIVYTITLNSSLVKRRYSEFEGLRTLLTRLYPTALVAPIPGKQGLTGRKDDAAVINMRKRMLTVYFLFYLYQVFLRRVSGHSVLSTCHALHLFLTSSLGWLEILSIEGYASLVKSREPGSASSLSLISPSILKNHGTAHYLKTRSSVSFG